MKKQIKIIFWAGIFIILLPMVLTILISGKEVISFEQPWNMEECLPMILCSEIPWDYEDETLKAQAVLARSSLLLHMETKSEEEIKKEIKQKIKEQKPWIRKKRYGISYKRMEKAVKATKGQVLLYKKTVCEGAFHQISAGETRAKGEFLQSVKSEQDQKAVGYETRYMFTKEALQRRLQEAYPKMCWEDHPSSEQIQVEQLDEQGYVTEIKVANQRITGEEFRKRLGLASSHFIIEEKGNQIWFYCQGKGHGFGMSQYGANQLALNGKTYEEILKLYFPKGNIEKMNTFTQVVNPKSKE